MNLMITPMQTRARPYHIDNAGPIQPYFGCGGCGRGIAPVQLRYGKHLASCFVNHMFPNVTGCIEIATQCVYHFTADQGQRHLEYLT